MATSTYTLDENLYAAIKKKDNSLVDRLLCEGVSVNIKDSNGKTPLHIAVLFNNIEVVDKLIGNGADINAKDSNGDTPLNYMVDGFRERTMVLGRSILNYFLRKGDDGLILECLVNRGARLDIPYKNNVSPLHAAVMMNSSSLVDKLMQRGFPVNVKDCNGITPLHIAFRLTHRTSTKPINILLDHGADIEARDNEGCSPLQNAIRYGSTSAVQFILSKGAKVNVKSNHGDTPLRDAIQKAKNAEKIEILLSHGASLETENIVRLMFGSFPSDFRTKCRNQIIKMYTAGFNVPQEAVDKVRNIQEGVAHQQLEEEYRKELRVINETMVAGKKLGVVLSSRRTPRYMANKELVTSIQELIDTPGFQRMFPNYALLLYCTFSNSRKIYNLFFLATRSLINLMSPNQVLPDEIIFKIVELLDDSTQRQLVRSGLCCPLPPQAADWSHDLSDFIRRFPVRHYLSDLDVQRLLRSMEPPCVEEWNDYYIYPFQ